VALQWQGDPGAGIVGNYSYAGSIILTGGTFPYVGSVSVPWSVDMSIGDADPLTWAALTVAYTVAASASQPPSGVAFGGVKYWIKQTYHCVNTTTGEETTYYKYAVDFSPGGQVCTNPDPPFRIKYTVSVGMGSGFGFLSESSPLGSCLETGSNAITAHGTDFQPVPLEDQFNIDDSDPDGFCLCVTGGVPPYVFAITNGSLPGGQSINATTGCLEGTADGTIGGTDSITITVVDATGASDTKTCGFTKPCSARTTEAVGQIFY